MSDCKYNRTSNSNNTSVAGVSNKHNNECCCENENVGGTNFREAVCIHTDKIYDSCRE